MCTIIANVVDGDVATFAACNNDLKYLTCIAFEHRWNVMKTCSCVVATNSFLFAPKASIQIKNVAPLFDWLSRMILIEIDRASICKINRFSCFISSLLRTSKKNAHNIGLTIGWLRLICYGWFNWYIYRRCGQSGECKRKAFLS